VSRSLQAALSIILKHGLGQIHLLMLTFRKIRNINKKITIASSNVDQVMKEFPEKKLDELVALRKINADQKVQFDKIPELQNVKDLLVEKLNMCQKLEDEFKAKLATDKAEFEKLFLESTTKDKEE
jgi:hypothetical protein